jgi:hypothetical protein
MIDDLWYKNAIFYCLNVGTFMNTENPAVQEEIRKIMGLWLQLGVSAHALRLSAGVTRLSPSDITASMSPSSAGIPTPC